MKQCKSCGKKFGMLEKVFYDDNEDPFCASCVKKKQEDTVKVVDIPEPKVPDKTAWEFRVIKFAVESGDLGRNPVTIEKVEKVINQMGDDGWELATITSLPLLLMRPSNREEPALVFKRPKSGRFF